MKILNRADQTSKAIVLFHVDAVEPGKTWYKISGPTITDVQTEINYFQNGANVVDSTFNRPCQVLGRWVAGGYVVEARAKLRLVQ
jgi:hypothetical protein